MLFSLLSGGDVREIIIGLLLTIPVIIIALSVHESAHGYIAYKMGDRTAYNLGRITLNPIKHLDPIGAIMMLLVGYGWAKPVPINTRNFKNPKRGMALTALAGPVSNIILSIIGSIVFGLIVIIAQNTEILIFTSPYAVYRITDNEILFNIFFIALRFINYFVYMNLVLAVFNLIPVPPFDGSRIFSSFLPTKWYFGIMKYERYMLIIVIGISFVCSRVFGFSPFAWVAENAQNALFSLIFKLTSNISF